MGRRTLALQNQIRSTTSGIEYDDTLDLSFAETLVNESPLGDPDSVSGTLIYDLNFLLTAIREIKGEDPVFNWFDPAASTAGLITLSGAQGSLSNLHDFTGSSGDLDGAPTYSSAIIITQSGDLETAIGELDAALATSSGVIDHIFSTEASVSIYDLVYITNTDDQVAPARADLVSTIEVIGMALETQGAIGQPVNVRCFGIVSGANTIPGIATGFPIFLDESTAGDFTDTPPSANGEFILQVGQTINADDVLVNVNSATAIQNSLVDIPVTSLNTLSGTVNIDGAGNITVTTDTNTNIITVSGEDFDVTGVSGSLQSQIQKERQVLNRTGGQLAADTVITLSDLDSGWTSTGDVVAWSSVDHFIDQTQFYLNGALQVTSSGASDDTDVYFVATPDQFAFEFVIKKNDIVQVWTIGSTATLI